MMELKLDMDLLKAMPTATLTPFMSTIVVLHMNLALVRIAITCYDWITTGRPPPTPPTDTNDMEN